MASNPTELLQEYCQKLQKALRYLAYSYNKALQLPMHFAELTEETLEVWESFAARFSRAADLFISKYIRIVVELKEPGFRGTTIDYLNQAEKIGLIDSAEGWVELRKLRNVTVHEYSDQAFDEYAKRLLALTPRLLELRKVLNP